MPPQAIEIEKAFLGELLIEGDKFNDVKTFISDVAFYKNENQIIYNAMHELNLANKKIDLLTVTNQVKGLVSALYISELMSRVGSALHIKEHSAIIYEKWVARELIKIGVELVDKCYDPDDILDVLQDTRNAMDNRLLHFLGINSTGISIKETADKSLDDYYKREAMRKENKYTGIPTTFKELNKKTGGLQKEQLIVLAGRPGMGKTSLAVSFMITAATYLFKCAFFSLEMTSERLTDKAICSIANIDHTAYKMGSLTEGQKIDAERSLDIINAWEVTFNDSMITTIEQVHANCKIIKERKGLDIIFIDYLQLMKTTEKTGSREQEISTISRKAKLMSVELKVPVVLLSQLSRKCEERSDKRPMLSDLRDSGAIEQDADIVLFVYRDVLYDKNTDNPDIGELLVSKHREGETGQFEFKHNQALTRFNNISDQEIDIDLMSPEKDIPF